MKKQLLLGLALVVSTGLQAAAATSTGKEHVRTQRQFVPVIQQNQQNPDFGFVHSQPAPGSVHNRRLAAPTTPQEMANQIRDLQMQVGDLQKQMDYLHKTALKNAAWQSLPQGPTPKRK